MSIREKSFIRHAFVAIFAVLTALTVFTSCKESDDDEEYANWKEKNEEFFKSTYTNALSRISAGDNSWKTFRRWSIGDDTDSFHADVTDNIVVKVIEESKSTSPSPLYTDTVRVAYSGRLIPSLSYSQGFEFDKTYSGTYDPATAAVSTTAVSKFTDGFATAVQHMKVGDRWQVYVPYQLGYGASGEGEIPGYSTLIFDMTLVSYYHPGKTVPDFKAKDSGVWIEE